MKKFQGFQKVDFVHGKPDHEWGIVRGWENDGFESLYQVECVCGHVGKYSEQDLKPRNEES